MSPADRPAREAAFLGNLSAALAVWALEKCEAAGIEESGHSAFLVLIQAAARLHAGIYPEENDEKVISEAADLLRTSAQIIRKAASQ